MHSTRACFAFITMSMKELQRKLLKKKTLYEKFFWGHAVELALVLVTMTLKVLVTSPTLRPWTAEADMADKWGSVMSAFTRKNHLSLETTEFWVGDRQVFGSDEIRSCTNLERGFILVHAETHESTPGPGHGPGPIRQRFLYVKVFEDLAFKRKTAQRHGFCPPKRRLVAASQSTAL